MAEDPKSKVKTEVKDGYLQLAEKMEQVRTQMVKMERKYDELYQTVKEKEHSKNPSIDLSAAEASKSPRDSTVDQPTGIEPPPIAAEKADEEPKKQAGEMDIEKLEDNPFL